MDDLQAEWKRKRTRSLVRVRVLQVLLGIGFIVAWQTFSGDPRTDSFVLIDSFYVSDPMTVGAVLWDWLITGELWFHTVRTLQEMLVGFGIGVVLGLITGFVLGTNDAASRVLNPYIVGVYSIPRLALVPLFVLWFGIGFTSKIAFVTMVVFFLVFFNTYNGVRDVSSDLIDIIRVMGATRFQLYRKVVLPAAMTWIVAGFQISVPYALVAAVTAEIISANRGLGYLLTLSANQFYVPGVFAAIVAMFLVSIVVNLMVILLDKKALVWKKSEMLGREATHV
jgi:NitT/TauT family transport system permease protein